MRIYISAKQMKKRSGSVTACPYELASVPETPRQLIAMLVSDGVSAYNLRLRQQEGNRVLSEQELDDRSRIGKIGFGIPFGTRQARLEEALETAFQGFADGLYRMFVGEREVEDLDAPLELRESDTVTVIRLVMLTGGMFW